MLCRIWGVSKANPPQLLAAAVCLHTEQMLQKVFSFFCALWQTFNWKIAQWVIKSSAGTHWQNKPRDSGLSSQARLKTHSSEESEATESVECKKMMGMLNGSILDFQLSKRLLLDKTKTGEVCEKRSAIQGQNHWIKGIVPELSLTQPCCQSSGSNYSSLFITADPRGPYIKINPNNVFPSCQLVKTKSLLTKLLLRKCYVLRISLKTFIEIM